MLSTAAALVVLASTLGLCQGHLLRGAAQPYEQVDAIQNVWRSAVAYCSKEQITSWNCAACDHVDVDVTTINYLYKFGTGAQAYVAKMKSGEALVSFRGSSNIQNWIDNIKFDKTYPFKETCPHCGVHLGFWEAYTSLKSDIMNALDSLEVQKSDPIVVTGHSLGAAEAALCIFDLRTTEGYTNIQTAYTFGEPRTGDKTFYEAYRNSSSTPTYRVVHWRDTVPHVPLEAMGFHHIPTEVWYNSKQSSFQVCDGSGEDPHCSDSLLFDTSIANHLNYLNISVSDSC